MIKDKEQKDAQLQTLAAQLEQIRTDLYKQVDDAIFNIARICAGASPNVVADVIAAVFHPINTTGAVTPMASKPVMTTRTLSNDTTASRTAKRNRVTDWTKSSDNALRQAHSKRRRSGMAIEPELNAELARRFHGYDTATQTFIGHKPPKGTVHPGIAAMAAVHKKPMTEWADITLKNAYYEALRKGDISAELNAELKRRFPEYDATTQKFVRKNAKSPKTLTWKKSLADLSDYTIKNMYYKLRDNGIPPKLNEELARRFPSYDKKTRAFVKLQRGEHIASAAEIEEIEHQQALAAARQRAEELAKKAAQRRADIAPAKTTSPQVTYIDDGDLIVTTKCLRISQDGPHYDVFVNGKRILHNHIGTKLQTFLNGTVLGVYGCVKDIPNFPDNPSWQVYDTKMSRRTFTQVHPYTKKSVYIKDIKAVGEKQIKLEVSNKMLVLLDQRPTQRIFKILSENTK